MPEALRPEATTFDRIAGWAARDSSRLALADRRERLTYAHLHAHAMRFTHLFEAAGIRRGDRVAVSQPGFTVELLAALACENLGAVSASFSNRGDPEARELFSRVDWVLSEREQDLPPGVRGFSLDQAFVARSMAVDAGDGAAFPYAALASGEPVRLLRTSGSTGRARWMLLSRAAQDARLRIHEQSRRFGTAATLVGAPFIVNAALLHTLACLRQGSPVARGTLEELADVPIGTFWGMPAHLEQFLAEAAAAPAFAQPVDVRLVGGFVSRQLRDRALGLLRGAIANPYGTNEVGIVCDSLDDAGEGDVLEGIDVRILDPAGRALPTGEGGTIAVRAPGAVQRYEGDAQATAQAFRDGWFITGDHGVLVAPRRLGIEGRHDELIAVGGHKLAARSIEDRIRTLDGVADVAVCALRDDARGAGLAIALVGRPGAQTAAIAAALPRVLDRELVALARFQFVAALPRTANGKVDRLALARLFAGPVA